MGHIQLLITAMSLIVAAGGTYGAERLFDRYGRMPEVQQNLETPVAATPDEEEDICRRAMRRHGPGSALDVKSAP